MSDISKEELKKEIAAILKDADLSSTSSKKVRQDIEAKLDIDLSSRRKEIDELVMEYIDRDKGKAKKNGNVEDEEDDDEEEENDDDEEEVDEEEEEEKKPKRSSNSKKAPPAKRKAASSDDEEEGSEDEGDDEYSPSKNSKKANKRGSAAGRKKKRDSDDSDEDWGKGKKKRGGGGGGGGAAKKAGGAKRGGGGGYTRPIKLSAELAAVVGEDSMPRHEVVKRIWAIIKERNLYDPKNKQFAICDDELLKVFGVKRFRTFGMMKFLKNHFKD